MPFRSIPMSQCLQRGSLEPELPKDTHCRIENPFFIEGVRPAQFGGGLQRRSHPTLTITPKLRSNICEEMSGSDRVRSAFWHAVMSIRWRSFVPTASPRSCASLSVLTTTATAPTRF